MRRIWNRCVHTMVTGSVVMAVFVAPAALAVVPPEGEDALRQHAFRHPDLDFRSVYRPLAELPPAVSARLGAELSRLGGDPGNAYFDPRTGRLGTLVVTQPLVPGSGVGNSLEWSDLGIAAPASAAELGDAAAAAFTRYLASHVAELRIDPAELSTPRVRIHGERVIQIHVGRVIDGIPVRGAFVGATINSGNLVLLGERKWGELALDTRPGIATAAAEATLVRHLDGIAVASFRKATQLEIVPVSSQPDEARVASASLRHRLVWVLTPTFEGDAVAAWEALVDAHNGELVAFQDTAHYASRRVEGGVYPVSNDQTPPDGVVQLGFPMPFADVAVDGDPAGFASTGGNAPSGGAAGTLSTTLSGRYLDMNDACGAVNESTASGDLDLDGVLGGTDCQVPPGHSPGDTNSTRSAFYEINRIQEQARGYLPDNGWLQQTLTANMNIQQTCNASWNGSVNFFRSGGGCSNTGELAGVFDHEWGHGMDNNDATGSVSNPGEGIADIFAQNRLNTSCIGRNFRPGVNCGGYGDPCTECTGIRDTDWAKRASGLPHDVAWIDANCGGGPAPCGGIVHCEGAVYSESVWDLVHRDLMDAPWNLDLNTALELGTRLTYYGSSNVGNWYQCTTDGTGGCNADGGYLNYLAVDDDNGNLEDGTPHMSAIFAAFDRHQIACNTPVVQDSGCAGGPTTAPSNVVATPINEGAHLTWNPVTGASEYWVYRTEGVHGCDFGKSLVGKTTSTEFVEFGLRNGFEVLYSVVAVGDNDACTSPMSACTAVSPVEGPGLGFDPSTPEWTGQTGDGDEFFDNCETGTLTFTVSNTGTGALTNVRIVEATIASHPEAEVLTPLPAIIAASLPEGESAVAELEVSGGGFAFNDTLTLEVTVTSDELDPLAIPHTYGLTALESDLEAQASLTFSFEAGEDGWQLESGIFDRTDAPPGGGNGTTFYRASSDGVDLSCDRIRSPIVELTATSTLELYNQFDIEPFSGGFWWDRANVGVFDPLTGERTIVSPDGGRTYNASGTNPAPAPCASHVPAEAEGWAGPGPDWLTSTWTATALGSPDLAGQLIQLDVAYGTDPAATGDIGFWFDEVTLTDISVQVADGQPDACGGGGGPIADITPDAFSFEVPQGGSDSDVLNIGNIGDADLTWSIDEAEGDALAKGEPYRYGLAEMPDFHAPVGYDRASGVRADLAGAPADRVVLPAPQPGVIDDLAEVFDDITLLPGAGWAMINNSEPPGPSSWFQGNETVFPAHEGEPNAYIAANFDSTDDELGGDISNWLIMPEVTLANGTQLTFWTRKAAQFEEYYDRLEVRMSTAGASIDVGNTAASVGTFTGVLLTINPDLEPNGYPEEWTQFVVTVSGLVEPTSGRIAFRYWVTDSGDPGQNGDYIGIDSVSIDQTGGGCASPTDIPWLAADPTSGTTPPSDSAPVDVTVDVSALDPGDYSARICVNTNDPEAPLVEVPVSLTVTPPAGGPIADITPESFSFEVPEGGSDSDTLNIGNLGDADLIWSTDEAESLALGGTEVVADGGFEAGSPSPSWEEGSTNFGTPLCTIALCGQGGGTGPHGGDWWVWLGGIAVEETGFVSQEVTIPTSDSAELRFWLEIPVADNAGVLDVSLGGDVLFSVTEADAGDFATYTEVILDVSAYADGGAHELRFDSTTQAGSNVTNFFVDDVSLMVDGGGGGGCDSPTDIPWLATDPTSGTTPPAGSVPVDVSVDASALDPGDYSAQLCVNTNDPGASVVPVPVTLTVVAGPVVVYTPVALAVDPQVRDSNGNGVFEPGEEVDVAPGWRNDTAVEQTLAGTASSFTGPAGAVYTLADDSADYGVVAAGEVTNCLDDGSCYAMGVDDPAVRPTTHWDATFDETLDDPAATGRPWTLHIGGSFTDVPDTNLFYTTIEALLHSGVTGGCTGEEYCPASAISRAQMAVFVLRAAEVPGYQPPPCVDGEEEFDDVPFDNQFCPWIEELFHRQVIAGCGEGNYCPGAPVTRAQMSIFLLKSLEGGDYTPPECSNVFTDVDCPSLFGDWIEDLFNRGITEGCDTDPLAYCPAEPVSRAQMSAFVTKTFALTLYGP